jgi:putative spermidine/putrescine transport system substrate-binding protein
VKALFSAICVAALVAVPTAFAAADSTSGSATTSSHAAKKTTVTVYASGDVNVKSLYTDQLIPGFEKTHKNINIKLVFSEHGTNDVTTLGRIGQAVKQRKWPGVDLVDGGLVTTLAIDGLTQPVKNAPKGTLPNMSKVDQSLLTPVRGAAIPYRGSSVVLAYDSAHVSSPPKTLDALLAWIKAHPGKFTYNSPNTGGSGYSFVETVLDKTIPASVTKQMVNGYVPDLEESNWKAGFETLKSLNGSVYQGVYPNGNQAVLDLLGKGQIWVAPVWSDQALTAMKQGLLGPSIKLTQIKSPSFTGGAAYLGVPKTARSKRDVYAFVNYILSVKAQTQIVNVMSGYPAIDVKYLNANLKKKFADVDANVLRQAYSSKMQNDVKAQWQQTVP